MPTSEEELAKRTREGWPETQGSPGEASGAAARDTRFKGRTDGQVHRTPLRGWKGSPPLPPPAAEAENFRENSPRGHLQSLPIHLPCRTPRPVPPGSACPTESLRGTRSQGFGRGGIPVCGENAAPTLTKTARDRQHLATTGEQAGQEERAVGLDWNKIGTSSQVVMVTILSSSTQRHDRASDEGIVSLREATQGCSGVVRTGPSLQRTSQG